MMNNLRIYKNDVIRIFDKDILDAMAFTLYNKTYDEVIQEEKDRWNDVWQQFMDLINPFKIHEYKFLTFNSQEEQKNYHLRIVCELLNNWYIEEYISDTYMVSETFDNYFKVGLLGSWQEEMYQTSGKLEEIREFLNTLKFPYKEINVMFGKLGCSYTN